MCAEVVQGLGSIAIHFSMSGRRRLVHIGNSFGWPVFAISMATVSIAISVSGAQPRSRVSQLLFFQHGS